MRNAQQKIFKRLIVSMSVGLLFGFMGWIFYDQPAALLWFTIGGALFYHHLRWLRKINKGNSNIKIKSFS